MWIDEIKNDECVRIVNCSAYAMDFWHVNIKISFISELNSFLSSLLSLFISIEWAFFIPVIQNHAVSIVICIVDVQHRRRRLFFLWIRAECWSDYLRRLMDRGKRVKTEEKQNEKEQIQKTWKINRNKIPNKTILNLDHRTQAGRSTPQLKIKKQQTKCFVETDLCDKQWDSLGSMFLRHIISLRIDRTSKALMIFLDLVVLIHANYTQSVRERNIHSVRSHYS